MKKVLGAALIGSLALGALTADPKFTLNYRTRAYAFSQVTTDVDGGNKTTNRYWLRQNYGATSTKVGYADPTDSLGIKIDNDNYGAQIQFNTSSDVETGAANGIAVLNTYNGWMRFENGLTLRAGTWKDGYANGAYRVKNMHDASSLEGIDGEANKLGGVFKGTNITYIDDMSNFKGNESSLSFLAEYPLDIDDQMSLNFLIGFVETKSWKGGEDNYTKWESTESNGDKETTTFYSGPVARIQFKMADTLDAELIWKNASSDNHAFGLYVMPNFNGLAGIPLTLSTGGAVGFTKNYKGDMAMESWEADLRAIFKVDDSLSIHTMNGIAGKGELDDGYTKYGQFNKALVKGAPDKTSRLAMWNMLGAQYIVNDGLMLGGNIGFLTPLAVGESSKTTDEYDKAGMQIRVTPFAQIRAAKNAFVNIGFSFGTTTNDKTGNAKTTITEFAVPVVFRVKC